MHLCVGRLGAQGALAGRHVADELSAGDRAGRGRICYMSEITGLGRRGAGSQQQGGEHPSGADHVWFPPRYRWRRP